jgi:hypothetical protein
MGVEMAQIQPPLHIRISTPMPSFWQEVAQIQPPIHTLDPKLPYIKYITAPNYSYLEGAVTYYL